MRLLAVDTTSAHGSLAVLEGDTIRGRARFRPPPGHAERLLPELDRLLVSLGLSLGEIDAFAVAVGPGSFTGLRIGIASVEGLAFATGRPVVGISTIEATAYGYRSRGGLVAPFLDARREEVFAALFRMDGGTVSTIVPPVCEKPKDFLGRVASLPRERILFAGGGLELYGAVVREVLGDLAELAEPVLDLAEQVGCIGRKRLEEGEVAPLGSLRAEYMRASDGEKAKR